MGSNKPDENVTNGEFDDYYHPVVVSFDIEDIVLFFER